MKAVKSVGGLSKHQHDRKMSQEHEFRCILLEVWELPETALCGESQKEKKATKIAQLPCNLPHRGCDTVEQFRIQGLEMLKRLAEHESLESYMQDTASL